MIHVYAFVRGLDALPDLPGIGGSTLETRGFGTITAVVSDVDAPGVDTRDAVQHGLVVESLPDRAEAVLPVRLGEPFADAGRLGEAVESRLAALERALGAVAGCVEIGVRVVDGGRDGHPVAAGGAEYMRARLGEARDRETLVAGLHRPLERASRDSVVNRGGLRVVHDAGYLVERDSVAAFTERVDAFAAANPALTVVCTGPWAPHSFASAA